MAADAVGLSRRAVQAGRDARQTDDLSPRPIINMVGGTNIAVGKVAGRIEGAGEAGSDEVGAQGAGIRDRVQEILVEVIADAGP